MNKKIEYFFVEKFYNTNSLSFSSTRYKPWPKVQSFLEKYNSALILDIGCGNGRNMMIYKENANNKICVLDKKYKNNNNMEKSVNPLAIGCDRSLNLLKLGPGSIRCDAAALPFKTNSFDILLSISVIHHLTTLKRRKDALLEMKRVMKEKAIIYVWDIKFKKDKSMGNIKEELEKVNTNKKYNDKNYNSNNSDDFFNENFYNENDVIVTWNKIPSRYVHFFSQDEFLTLLKSVDFEIIEFGEEGESLYAIVEK
ncbi:putative methyltransferase [Dictyocoela muelleri]|nr:putative methyltransferase [Dictyocoela muelleri]